MSEILTAAGLIPLLTAGIRMSVPLILGSVGEVVSEKTGVLNIGLEGQMLTAALISFIVAYYTGSLTLGILAGGISGMLGALVIAFWSVSRRQDQSVVGIMFNIFAIGFTNFLYRAIFGVSTNKAKVEILPTIEIPGLSRIPWLGEILFRQNMLVYLALIAAFLVLFLLRRTKLASRSRRPVRIRRLRRPPHPRPARAVFGQPLLRLHGGHRRRVSLLRHRRYLYGEYVRGARLHLPCRNDSGPLESGLCRRCGALVRHRAGASAPAAGAGLHASLPIFCGAAVCGDAREP
jgi:hypothetical protein